MVSEPDLYHQTFTEGATPNDRAPVIILDGTSQDLGSRSRALIHQHHQGNLLVRATSVGLIVLTWIAASFGIDNQLSLRQELIRNLNR